MAHTSSNQTAATYGWVSFAAVIMMIQGALQMLYGLAAILHQTWYVYTANGAYVFDVAAWGWAVLLIGILLFVSGLMLAKGNLFGRVMGIVFAGLNLISNLALIPVAPFWSVVAVVIDAAIIYAISTHHA